MIKKIYLPLFFLIFFLSIFLRIYKLSEIPPGVNQDEASIGYTAYSLLKTGADEYGKRFPISFRSFGDWKLPFYQYSVVPRVAVFGLNEFAVRLPSALVGIATVLLVFFLAWELFRNYHLSFLSMFLLSISPWHLHLSRVESEANMAVFFTTLGVLLFLKGIKGKHWLIVISFIFLALTYYTYAGNYIFTTLLLFGLFVLYRSLFLKTKSIIVALSCFFLLSGFIFTQTIFSANKTKLSGINIFGDPSVIHAKIEIPRNQHVDSQSLFARMFHNRVSFGIERFAQNYLNSFSPGFLFIKGGDNKAHNIDNFGNMYLVEAPFLFLGVMYLLFNKKKRENKFILWWLLIAPIASSITKDAPHSNRMFVIFPILPLVVAMGIVYIIPFLSKYKKVAIGILSILFAFNFSMYMDRYYIHFPYNQTQHWGNGYKNLTNILSKEKYRGKQIIMDHPEYSHYIYILFYTKYDPKKYQESAIRYPATSDGFIHVKSFDRYEFREIKWGEDLRIPNRLIIAFPDEVPNSVRYNNYSISEVILPNQKSMFTIIETR